MTELVPGERILVSGATGFVGRRVVKGLLDDGIVVGALVRDESADVDGRAIRLTIGETTEDLAQEVLRFGPTAVVHTATYFVAQHAPSDIVAIVEANILFGARLLDAMRRCAVCRLINFGTLWQHLDGPAYRPVSLYAASKQAFETMCAYYVDAHQFRVLTLKLSDTYGPDDSRAKLLPMLAKLDEGSPKLPMSAGEQLVAFVHVDDVIEAVRCALRLSKDLLPSMQDFSVAGDEVISLRAFVEKVGQALGRELPIDWGVRPYRAREVMRPYIGPRMPGWAPKISLDQGLRAVLSK